jgi:hypothetical protein
MAEEAHEEGEEEEKGQPVKNNCSLINVLNKTELPFIN